MNSTEQIRTAVTAFDEQTALRRTVADICGLTRDANIAIASMAKGALAILQQPDGGTEAIVTVAHLLQQVIWTSTRASDDVGAEAGALGETIFTPAHVINEQAIRAAWSRA